MSRILRVREIWEQRERSRVGQALARAHRAETVAATASAQHVAALQDSPGWSPLLTFTAQTATHEQWTLAEQAADHARMQAEATRGVWRRARQDLEIAERLVERRRLAERAEEARLEVKTLDEMAALRHGRTA